MEFQFTANGEKSLFKLEKNLIKRVLDKLDFWRKSEDPLRYAEKIEGYKFLKYRIGNYRLIIYPDFKNQTIDILKVGHRGNVYKNLDRL